MHQHPTGAHDSYLTIAILCFAVAFLLWQLLIR